MTIDGFNRSKIETPSSTLTPKQLQDLVARINEYKNGARNIYFSAQEIKSKIDNKLRINPSLTIEEAVENIITERRDSIDGLNEMVA